jgi:hypothetical protein
LIPKADVRIEVVAVTRRGGYNGEFRRAARGVKAGAGSAQGDAAARLARHRQPTPSALSLVWALFVVRCSFFVVHSHYPAESVRPLTALSASGSFRTGFTFGIGACTPPRAASFEYCDFPCATQTCFL